MMTQEKTWPAWSVEKEQECKALILGYQYGIKYGACSPREAEDLLTRDFLKRSITDGLIQAFCNGADDGVVHDSWRIECACAAIESWQKEEVRE